jgi:hypothetical protein
MAYHKTRKLQAEEESEIDLAALATAIAAEEFANLDNAAEKDASPKAAAPKLID